MFAATILCTSIHVIYPCRLGLFTI